MKKQFLKSAFLACTLVTAALCSCGDDNDGGSNPPTPPTKEVQITANLTGMAQGSDSWNYMVLLYKGAEMQEMQAVKNAAFTVETNSEYFMQAIGIDKLTNLTIPDISAGDRTLKIKNVNSAIPTIFAGASTPKTITKVETIDVPMTSIVSQLNISVTEVPANVSKITAKIEGLNDQITMDGQFSASAAGLFKTTTLTQSETTFAGMAILLPCSTAQQTITYTITYSDGTPQYSRTIQYNGALLPGQEMTATSTLEEILVYASGTLTYAPWGTSQSADGDFEVELPTEIWTISANDNAMAEGDDAPTVGTLANLIDGDVETGWTSTGWTWPKTVTVDMQTSKTVKSVTLTRATWTYYYFQVHVSDEIPTIATIPDDGDANNIGFDGFPSQEITTFANGNATGRYVTIVFNKHGNGWENLCELAEIGIAIDQAE